MSPLDPPPIPVTVFTGFLGSGKTTVILGLLPQLPKDYKVVLLKNEFGDVEVDSQLAKQSSLAAVSEILNGCMCCILVGQMKTALLEIRDKYRPDRIIIESSGSAFPATLAFQIRDLEKETGDFKLDAIVTVIDAENFTGYEDTSVTAKMQAQYSDMLLLNKWETVSERQLDIVLDHLYTLNETTPKLRTSGKQGVAPSLIFGLDTNLWDTTNVLNSEDSHHSEVETVTIRTTAPTSQPCEGPTCGHSHHHHNGDIEGTREVESAGFPITEESLEEALSGLSKESVYRVKGFIQLASRRTVILNWAFGRYDITPYEPNIRQDNAPDEVLLTMMGEPGEIKRKWGPKLAEKLGARCC